MERLTPVAAPAPVAISTHTMLCPRCALDQPVHDFVMLGMSPLYASQPVPVYRCGACGHRFALRPGLLGAT